MNVPDWITQAERAHIDRQYAECIESCQDKGAQLAELEDLLFDDPDLEEFEELADAVRELLRIKEMWKGCY